MKKREKMKYSKCAEFIMLVNLTLKRFGFSKTSLGLYDCCLKKDSYLIYFIIYIYIYIYSHPQTDLSNRQ